GAGLGLAVGGLVVQHWDASFGAAPPFGMHGWQMAFFVVGLPGLLLALWVRSLREPVRGSAEGLVTAPAAHPWASFLHELRAVMPPLTLLHLGLAGARMGGIARNLAAAAVIALVAALLIHLLGTP